MEFTLKNYEKNIEPILNHHFSLQIHLNCNVVEDYLFLATNVHYFLISLRNVYVFYPPHSNWTKLDY